jgi:hypothetical protein
LPVRIAELKNSRRRGELLRLRFQYRLRTLIVVVAGLSLAMAYVGSYYRLSRRGIREASIINLPGFLYVSFEEVVASRGDLTQHHWLTTFYFPVNWIDHHLFGGKIPTRNVHWRIGR